MNTETTAAATGGITTVNNTSSTNTAIISGHAGGSHVTDGPLTVSAIREASPGLLVNETDSRVVRIRPMATPVDQISRMTGSRQASSMVVEYYSVDTRPVECKATSISVTPGAKTDDNGHLALTLHTENYRLFAATETIMLPGVEGIGGALVLYVTEAATSQGSGIKVLSLNQLAEQSEAGEAPALNAEQTVVRMGRAAAELDVQTAQFEALPKKEKNYCQIFKTQVEQSSFARLSAKEVGWTFSDQEEVAIMDMRLGMEKSFLFGTKARLTDPLKFDEVLFTGGIWNQAATTHAMELSDLKETDVLDMMQVAFTGDAAGSNRKILVAGSALILALNKISAQRMFMAGDTVTRWGIDFNELRSKFGSLYVIHSEVFDQCGHKNDGLIIDPQYLTKYTHVPFRVEQLDLKKSGVRNTDALVATEASCLVLRHPKAHVKITGSWLSE